MQSARVHEENFFHSAALGLQKKKKNAESHCHILTGVGAVSNIFGLHSHLPFIGARNLNFGALNLFNRQ